MTWMTSAYIVEMLKDSDWLKEDAMIRRLIERRLLAMMEIDGVQHRNHMRVDVNPDGTFTIVDFTLPSLGDKLKRNVPQEDVPQWVIESISMLRICESGEHVSHVGVKITDTAYYIYDRTGEGERE